MRTPILISLALTVGCLVGWLVGRQSARPDPARTSLRSRVLTDAEAGRVWLIRAGHANVLLYDSGLGSKLNDGYTMNLRGLPSAAGRRIGDCDLWVQRIWLKRGGGDLYLFRVAPAGVSWQVADVGWGDYFLTPDGRSLLVIDQPDFSPVCRLRATSLEGTWRPFTSWRDLHEPASDVPSPHTVTLSTHGSYQPYVAFGCTPRSQHGPRGSMSVTFPWTRTPESYDEPGWANVAMPPRGLVYEDGSWTVGP